MTDQPDDIDDRLMLLPVALNDVISLLTGNLRVQALPADARIVQALAPYDVRGLMFVVRSREFAPVKSGHEIPQLFSLVVSDTGKKAQA